MIRISPRSKPKRSFRRKPRSFDETSDRPPLFPSCRVREGSQFIVLSNRSSIYFFPISLERYLQHPYLHPGLYHYIIARLKISSFLTRQMGRKFRQTGIPFIFIQFFETTTWISSISCPPTIVLFFVKKILLNANNGGSSFVNQPEFDLFFINVLEHFETPISLTDNYILYCSEILTYSFILFKDSSLLSLP